MHKALSLLIACTTTLATLGTARAEDPGDRGELAGQAYDRGAAAFDAKDYPHAAEEFARADGLAPNPLALKLALDSAMRAGRAGLVMELAARARARGADKAPGGDPAIAGLVQRAHDEYQERAGGLTVHCEPPRVCDAQIDERPFTLNARAWVDVGRHVLHVRVGDREARRDVVIMPRDHVELHVDDVLPPPLPSAAAAAKPSRSTALSPVERDGKRRPLSPTWFWVGAATTAAIGGLAIASGVDTMAKHDAYEADPSNGRRDAGLSAQARTNVLWGITAIGAISTTTLAVFFVNWSHRRTPTHAATPRTSLGLGTCFSFTQRF